MSDTLADWSLPYTVKTLTRTTTDFVESVSVATRVIQAVVQFADKSKLNSDQIDWALQYLLVHTSDPLQPGEYIHYAGGDYKIVQHGEYQLYGFTAVVAEQTKRAGV